MIYDVFIIGGGVNGAAIARDAAGRGLRTGLCERDDLGSHTSSASTKLIHGGLRYLEHFAFRLVRESLIERETLLRAAPHIIWPMRFVLPHHQGLRPAWMLRLGLTIYDHLGGRGRLPGSRSLRLDSPPLAGQLRPGFKTGFEYSDCWVEDSRLVALNAVDACERGADIFTRTGCTGLQRAQDAWTITLKGPDGAVRSVRARTLVNAAGPWAGEIEARADPRRRRAARLVKGSHIVVPRLYPGAHAWIFQNTDGRIVFAIPYEGAFTLIGTTDIEVSTPEEGRAITARETQYLCDLASAYFAAPVTPGDVVWSFAGVRPLLDDETAEASKITRDYTLELNRDAAALLSVHGGKITTSRRLAEQALGKLSPLFPGLKPAWTRTAPLPGGDIPDADFDAFLEQFRKRTPWMDETLSRRLARAYGARAERITKGCKSLQDLGAHLGAGLHERELEYLADEEFACTAEDALWRRSKLGLHMNSDERLAVQRWFEHR